MELAFGGGVGAVVESGSRLVTNSFTSEFSSSHVSHNEVKLFIKRHDFSRSQREATGSDVRLLMAEQVV